MTQTMMTEKQEYAINVPCRRCDGSGELEDYYEDGETPSCGNCQGDGRERHQVYANVYRVSRCYGGPEEGGWWYDVGEPLESVRIDPLITTEEVEALEKRLKANWGFEQSERGRYSMAGGADVSVIFENHFAQEWPERAPRYE